MARFAELSEDDLAPVFARRKRCSDSLIFREYLTENDWMKPH
jgi:hypothetical protein